MIDAASIIRYTGGDAFEKGRAYTRQNRVVSITIDQHSVDARVIGSITTPYRVWMAFDDEDILEASCSCPLEDQCKHIAAVGIEVCLLLRKSYTTQNEKTISDVDRMTAHQKITALKPKHGKQSPRPSRWTRVLERMLAKNPSAPSHRPQILLRLSEDLDVSRFRHGHPRLNLQLRPRAQHIITGKTSFSLLGWSGGSYYNPYSFYQSDFLTIRQKGNPSHPQIVP